MTIDYLKISTIFLLLFKDFYDFSFNEEKDARHYSRTPGYMATYEVAC